MPVDEDLDERRIIQRIPDDLRLKAPRAEPSRPSPGVAPVADDLSLLHAGLDTELFNRSVDMLNELIFGDQDYAIIGTKRSPEVADS
jgi:hypothetical protein